MDLFLSKDELEGYLYKIRNTLCTFDYQSISNVIFFNNEVVYEYLCKIPLIGSEDESVGDALDTINSYIPVSLTENSLKFIMQSANSPESIPILEAEFSKKNRMEFLQLVTEISSGAEWSRLLTLCETIRSFRVNGSSAVLV